MIPLMLSLVSSVSSRLNPFIILCINASLDMYSDTFSVILTLVHSAINLSGSQPELVKYCSLSSFSSENNVSMPRIFDPSA